MKKGWCKMKNKWNTYKENNKHISDRILLAIQGFFECDSAEEELSYYITRYDDLKNCKFLVYSDTRGIEFPECFKSNFENDFALIEIGCSDRYYVIDAQICKDMLNGKDSNYNFDICVELDTQAISYLSNMFKSIDEINVRDDKKQMLYYLSKTDVNYSSLPYMIENSKKITRENFVDCYLNLKSYEIFKNIDFDLWIESGIKKFRTDESNMMTNVDGLFKTMKSIEFQNHFQNFFEIQEHIYCLLIKAVLIENNNPKKSAENKIKMLIDFMNNSLGVYCEREMAICYYYFKHDINTEKFFRKTKLNSKNKKSTINSMAWDLTHVRLIEFLYDFTCLGPVKFGIHPILTFDNGLKDVLRLCPVKKIAVYEGSVLVWYKTSFVDIFPEARELICHPNVRARRREVFNPKNIRALRYMLEEEID